MALTVYPDRTIILDVGGMRPIADLACRSYVRLTNTPECRQKIKLRLRLAGCRVHDEGEDWLAQEVFANLAAYDRKP